MNKKIFIKVLILFAFGSLTSLCFALDAYWISFTSFTDVDQPGPEPGGPKYLMKIDVLGNILVPPTKIDTKGSGYVSPGFGATALSRAGLATNLTMWFPHMNQLGNGNHVVYKAIINKSTLRVVSIEKTEIRTGDIHLISAKQKAKRNFIVVDFHTGSANFCHDLLAHSAQNPSSSWLLQECLTEYSTFAVSGDGRALFYSQPNLELTRTDLFFQLLGTRGRPVGDPQLIARCSSCFLVV